MTTPFWTKEREAKQSDMTRLLTEGSSPTHCLSSPENLIGRGADVWNGGG